MRPLISVVMPVFNASEYISQAIKSILVQSFKSFEFIIINDASTDDTVRKIRKFRDKRIILLRNTSRKGVAYSLNKGTQCAKGAYIARMDADDISLPNRLTRQLSVLQKNKEIAMVGSWVRVINSSGNFVGYKKTPVDSGTIIQTIFIENPFVHSSVVIRKKVLEKVRGYNEGFEGAEDYDLFLRIIKDYSTVNLPEVLLHYRVTSSSVSSINIQKVLRQSLNVRVHALKKYNYPLWQGIYLIKPLCTYFIPASVKKKLLIHYV